MFGGKAFASLWRSATSGAKAAAADIARGGRETVADLVKAGDAAAQQATETAHVAEEAAQRTARRTLALATSTEQKAVKAGTSAVSKVKSAFEQAFISFGNAVAGAVYVACLAEKAFASAENAYVKEKASKAAESLADPARKKLQDVILGKKSKPLPYDGVVLGAECKTTNLQRSGVLPKCPNGAGKPQGKITYINGISTDYVTRDYTPDQGGGICKTMQALANATCAEVIGVYNATGGIRADVRESLTNIAKNSVAPSVQTLKVLMLQAIRKGETMTVYAHSQGGLITQEALAALKNELTGEYGAAKAEQQMGLLSVKSFGTAEQGWPKGPKYEQFTNDSDPVPGVIAGAQKNYPEATFHDNAYIPPEDQHPFNIPHLNPLDSHSMDDVYIKEMVKIHGQPNCCG